MESRVNAPVPWFPFRNQRFGEYAQYASTPLEEARHSILVSHPRYFLPPALGINLAPYTLALSILTKAREFQRSGFDFDLIDAHYHYPDGVAAGIVARKLNKPFVVTACGTDLSLIPEYLRPRRLILETTDHAKGSIGVCKALMDRLAALGADPTKLHVMRNGIDLERFYPIDQSEARERLNFGDERILLLVGHPAEHNKTGILFNAGDRNSQSNALLSLLNDQQCWPELKATGRTFVETVCNWRNSVANHRAPYHRRIGKSD